MILILESFKHDGVKLRIKKATKQKPNARKRPFQDFGEQDNKGIYFRETRNNGLKMKGTGQGNTDNFGEQGRGGMRAGGKSRFWSQVTMNH